MSAAVWSAAVALGALGALARSLVDLAVRGAVGSGFPAGILLANLTGAFAAGIIVGVTDSPDVALVLAGGFLGGYTTFSTWMLDTMVLWAGGRRAAASVNLLGSAALGLGLAAAGWSLAAAVA